jgi:hypothetical protein
MMLKMGSVWVSMIMRCVRSVRFSAKLNGGLSDSFLPSRGCARAILSHHIFFYFVWKVFRPYSNKLRERRRLLE